MGTGSLHEDARRLLHVIALYGSTAIGAKAWVKDFLLKALVFAGAESDIFKTYRLVPQVVEYLSNRHYAMISRDAENDLNALFGDGLIEKVVLNTEFHSPEIAWRLAGKAWDLVNARDFLPEEDAAALRPLIHCRYCNVRCYDYIGVNNREINRPCGSRALTLCRVCSCYRKRSRYRDKRFTLFEQDELLEGFFSIGDCEYVGRALFMENINEWSESATPVS